MKTNTFINMVITVGFLGCGGNSFGDLTSDTKDANADVIDAASDSKLDVKLDAGHDATTTDTSSDTNPPDSSKPDTGHDAGPEAAVEAGLNCPADLNPGDLIQGSNSGVFYYGEDCKRHLFPNEDVFYSWFTADDFNLIKTIPNTELDSIMTGLDVKIRPGTWLVKIQSDPKTYAVTGCGKLHWIESESIMAALYGANWNTRIKDIPPEIFGQYTLSTPITVPVHPDEQLISYAGDPNYYVVMSGTKRKIASTAAFNANRFQAKFAVATTIPYDNGTDVTYAEPDNFWHIVCP